MTIALPRARRRSRYAFDVSARYCLERPEQSLDAVTGEAATFARAGLVTGLDAAGVLRRCAHSQPCFQWYDLDGDGIRETPMLLLRAATDNIVLQSEDFGTTWTAVGTPTRVAGAHTASGVSLDLIGDDTGAMQELYRQSLTFTGDGAKGALIHMKAGLAQPGSGSRIQIEDTTASASRLTGVVTWSGSGVPSVSVSAGSYLGSERMAGGVYRLLFSAAGVVAANANRLNILPATISGEQGNVYAGGVQVQNDEFPSGYFKTTTGSVSGTADSLVYAFYLLPQSLTAYWRGVDQGTVLSGSGAARVFEIGATDNRMYVAGTSTAGTMRGVVVSGGVTYATSGIATGAAIGDLLEYRLALSAPDASGLATLTFGVSRNGGAEQTATVGSVVIPSAWDAATLTLNASGTGGNVGRAATQRMLVDLGATYTMAQLRAG